MFKRRKDTGQVFNTDKNNFKRSSSSIPETDGIKIGSGTKNVKSLGSFKIGDIVQAFNGRIGKIIDFEISGDEPDFNFARVATTFGSVMSVRESNLTHAVPEGIKTDEDGTINPKGEFLRQLPVDKQAIELIDEAIEKHEQEEKELTDQFVGKTVTFTTGSEEFPPIKERIGKVVEASVGFEGGLFGSDKKRLTVIVDGEDREFSPFAEDVEIQ